MAGSNRFRLNCESLESRENPDGNVSVSVWGGSIYMLGDGVGNHVRLNQDIYGRLTVTGYNNTTINGQGALYLGQFTPGNVYIHGDGGSDTIEVYGLRAAGTLTIIPGDEYDRVDLGGVTANVVNVDMGAGNDTLIIQGLTARVSLMLNGGSGYDLIQYSGVSTPRGYVIGFEQQI